MRASFGKPELRAVFENIGKALSCDVEVFLIGGGAMCFRNQKNATKDLDIVFRSEKECRRFIRALENLGFEKHKIVEAEYKKMKAAGIWQNKAGFRFDIFVKKVCGALELSKSMASRSELLEKFANLEVRVVSNEDIMLFKGITERVDDANDIAAIVRTSKIDWNIIMEECITQSKAASWYGLLYNKLAEIKERHGIDAPIAGKILRLYKKSLVKEAYAGYIKKGLKHEEAIAELKKRGFTQKEIGDAS
ncbi:MAG: DUF6036 family nucleotidyltransferase [Candidatus Micrarchaeota archaeon]